MLIRFTSGRCYSYWAFIQLVNQGVDRPEVAAISKGIIDGICRRAPPRASHARDEAEACILRI